MDVIVTAMKQHASVAAVQEDGCRALGSLAMNTENMETKPTDLAALFDPPFTTVHVGMIEGGLNLNSVPDHSEFTIDIRTDMLGNIVVMLFACRLPCKSDHKY